MLREKGLNCTRPQKLFGVFSYVVPEDIQIMNIATLIRKE